LPLSREKASSLFPVAQYMPRWQLSSPLLFTSFTSSAYLAMKEKKKENKGDSSVTVETIYFFLPEIQIKAEMCVFETDVN